MASLQGFANISDKYLHGHRSEVPYPIDNFSFEDAITDGFATTAPVASFRPNAFGLHDIIGNVMEWCDGVSLDREQSHLPVRPLRGGNWASTLRIVRSASHHGAGAPLGLRRRRLQADQATRGLTLCGWIHTA
jgi:hypothetical protein